MQRYIVFLFYPELLPIVYIEASSRYRLDGRIEEYCQEQGWGTCKHIVVHSIGEKDLQCLTLLPSSEDK